jgi:DNA-binding transcriptional regulator YiaG
MGKMRVLSANAIKKHYNDRAIRIKRTAMPEAEERLLKLNEEEMQKFLQILERDGYIEVIETGQNWQLNEFRSRLKWYRESKGMSQSQLAKASGVNVRMIQDYEQGHKDINRASVITVLQLAEALEVDVYDIINPR